MGDFEFSKYLDVLYLYFPLGLIGAYRWSVWFFKKVVAEWYTPVPENKHQETLSVVVPVYNEDPHLFRMALESWICNRPDEIIAVIDHTDQACREVFQSFQRERESLTLLITERPGKRQALSDGIRVAKHNIIALVDSDTIWDPNIKEAMLAPFIDPLVGGVGPRQEVLEPNTLARRLFSIHLDQRYLDEMKYLTTVGDAITCLSGRTALYRRAAIYDLCSDLEHETFWGVQCVSGDDKCLTRLVQGRGWKVRYQATARVLTTGVADLPTFFKQQLRWTRNSYRSDLKSLFGKNGWVWKREKALAYHMIDKFTQPFTLILGPVYFFFSLVWGHWMVALSLVVWWLVSRGIKLYPHLKRRPSDIAILPLYICATYFMAILKIYALMTIRRQGWITRWDKSRLATIKFFRFIPAYVGTIAVVAGISVLVGHYESSVAISSYNPVVVSAATLMDLEAVRRATIANFESFVSGRYIVQQGDTLSNIAWKYGMKLPTLLDANEENFHTPNTIAVGQTVIVPFEELRKVPKRDGREFRRNPKISFHTANNTIAVEGEGAMVTLPTIRASLGNSKALEPVGRGEWVLRANLVIGKNVVLMVEGDTVTWLKLKSDRNGFVSVKIHGGSAVFQNTKVTSWNESAGEPHVTDIERGRSFVLTQDNGRMDIVNSELAFLGWDGMLPGGQLVAGAYGVSWKSTDGSPSTSLMTGYVAESRFHDNYFGVYTYGVSGMTFLNNSVFSNTKYGLDFHDGSRGMLIENNKVYQNGIHGIILSRGNFFNMLKNNLSYDNGFHGIMFHEDSNSNLAQGNTVKGNIDGIVIHGSHRNVIQGNRIIHNQRGIRISSEASHNQMVGNTIMGNETGVFLYDDAHRNAVVDNSIEINNQGVQLKDSVENLLRGRLKGNFREIAVGMNDKNFIETLE
jgi:hyaluronan synthase